MSEPQKNWTAIGAGALIMLVIAWFVFFGGKSDFQRFADHCDGTAYWERGKHDSVTFRCDKGYPMDELDYTP